jgi:hypothetical protein
MTEQATQGDNQNFTAVFYKNPIGVDQKKHKNYKFAPVTNDGFEFAANAKSVPLTAIELNDVCREYPIIFVKGTDGEFTVMAALSLDGKTNSFVKNGYWMSRYIPAFVRRYPFIPGSLDNNPTATDASRFSVMIDETYKDFSPDAKDGKRLFDDNGQPTDDLKNITEFLRNFHTEYLKTLRFVKELENMDLLVSKNIDVTRRNNDKDKLRMTGVWVVDEEKLRKLDSEKVNKLFSSGALFLIYAHLLSLRNFSAMFDKKDEPWNLG